MKTQSITKKLRNRPALYGRLGYLKDVRAQVRTAEKTGATVQWGEWEGKADRVEVTAADGSLMFKALDKGSQGVWLFFYNPFFYPRDTEETAVSVAAVTESHAKENSHCGFFFRSTDGGRVLGADGVERTGADKVALIALPKFRDVAAFPDGEIKATRFVKAL